MYFLMKSLQWKEIKITERFWMIGKRKAKGRIGGGSGKKNTLLTLECTSRTFSIPSFLKENSDSD